MTTVDGHASDPGPVSTPPAPAADGPPVDEGSLLWSDARKLGYAPMDRTHEVFYAVAFRLLTCGDDDAAAAIAAFEDHAVEHFGQEEAWMHESAFPAAQCHVDEHAAVLASVREVRAMLASGQAGPALLHDLAQHLFAWFPGHADYLDSALAAWMSKRQYGGQPVVLKRRGA